MTSQKNHLEIALSAPCLPSRPRVLLLCDSDQNEREWLVRRGAEVETGEGPHTISSLMDRQDYWDLIVATHSMQRFYETSHSKEIERFSQWLREHGTLCLLTPRKFLNDPARNSVGPWRLDDDFLTFEFMNEFESKPNGEPIVALSDSVLWDGEKWRERRDFLQLDHFANPASGEVGSVRRRRQHVGTDNTIFKIEIGSPEYFESLEVIREAEAIEALKRESGNRLRLPNVLSLKRGTSVSCLHRELIEGIPLLSALEDGTIDREGLFEQVVDCAISYARLGLFHNDFRPWNMLVTPEGLVLIDFAAVSRFDVDTRRLPQVVALLGTMITLSRESEDRTLVRTFEYFDEDVLTVLNPVLNSLGIPLESLYTESWIELPKKREIILERGRKNLTELVRAICT